jgi:hypothetical protein
MIILLVLERNANFFSPKIGNNPQTTVIITSTPESRSNSVFFFLSLSAKIISSAEREVVVAAAHLKCTEVTRMPLNNTLKTQVFHVMYSISVKKLFPHFRIGSAILFYAYADLFMYLHVASVIQFSVYSIMCFSYRISDNTIWVYLTTRSYRKEYVFCSKCIHHFTYLILS